MEAGAIKERQMIDKSGEPRSILDLIETREAVKRELIKSVAPIVLYYPIIIEALTELIEIRKSK